MQWCSTVPHKLPKTKSLQLQKNTLRNIVLDQSFFIGYLSQHYATFVEKLCHLRYSLPSKTHFQKLLE